MHIVTSGSPYLDIDGYAGCIAFAELLQVNGLEAQAVSTAPLNDSITETIRSWDAPLATSYQPKTADTFALVDISDSDYFDDIVAPDRVETVIDHHVGFEAKWQERLGEASHIEFIGAACTLVYELWKADGQRDKMSQLSARLLICGLLDNTLNFGASVTTDRDRAAYADLLLTAELPDDWPAQYFSECQDTILQDPKQAIDNDTKALNFPSFDGSIQFGQLALWDGKAALADYQEIFSDSLASKGANWCLNLIGVGDGKSYFVSDSPSVQLWLSKLLNVDFDGDVAVANRLWLRKEITKQDMGQE